MLELLVLGTLWFWLVLGAQSIAIVAFVEAGYGRGATGTALVTGVVLVAANGWWVPLKEHPWYALAALGGYVLVGVGYAVLKWWVYVRDRRVELDKRIKDTLGKSQSIEAWVAARQRPGYRSVEEDVGVKDFWATVERPSGYTTVCSRKAPQAAQHKARIITWMSYWPWSATWTLVNDPVRRIFRTLYHEIAGQLQRIADRAWAGVPQ